APTPPDGFAADYLLLGLNLVMLWAVLWLVFDLARRLFDARTAWLALLATLLSTGVRQQTVAVAGTPLRMLLGLGVFWIWARVDELGASEGSSSGSAARESAKIAGWLFALGVGCGLLFLAEYSAGAVVLVAVGYAVFASRARRRWMAPLCVVAGFAMSAGPWIARNVALTGHPAGLAGQNVALKFGDSTAEPANQRNTLSAESPAISLNKVGNKTLTALQENLKARIWSGGAMWLAAFFVAGCLYTFRSAVANRLRWIFAVTLVVAVVAQAGLNSGESERLAAGWLAPLVIVFGAGFFFVLLGSNAALSHWPRTAAAVLLTAQAVPLAHDVLEPRRLHFQYPPYFPGLFIGMRQELERRDHSGRFGAMADVPAGVAWYGRQRVWSQPVKLRDFYAITLEQPIGELLLTPRTLDRPFFSELAARPADPGSLLRASDRFGDWGRVYAGLFTGVLPPEFPLGAPQKLAENLYVLLNPALPPPGGK
ncbi:MAG TPA: hypothetical protein VEQ65_03720, partial [Opitutus sp.]|nr:hypothetical protein [Opitutus sp.]